MSLATLPPSSGGKKKAPLGYTLNGAYYRRKIERGVEHKIHAGVGSEYVRVRGTRPDGRRYDVCQPVTSLKELRQVAARIKTEMASGTHVEPSRVTVESLWESWKEEWESLIASGERSPRSLVNVQGRIRKYVIPTIGTMRVTEVRSHHIVKVLNAGRTAELSSASLDSLRDVCSGLLQHGVDTGVTQRNVARDLPKSAKPKVTPKFETLVLDADEIERVLEATPKGVYRVFLTALTELGLREAECRGLRWGKIDWETNRISVTHQLGRNGRGLSGLKTTKSARTVVLTGKLRAALVEHRLASQHTGDDDLIFYAWGQRGLDYSTCRRVFQRSLTKAGIDYTGRRCSLHALRHSFASRLVRSGTDIVTVSKLLGHAKVSMTLDTYSHYLPSQGEGDTLLDSVERGLAANGGAS